MADQKPNQTPSHQLDDRSSDFERRFEEETARIRAEGKERSVGSPPVAQTAELSPMQRKWVWGSAVLLASLVTVVGVGHKTIGEGFRAIFPDDSPPITHPVKSIIDNHG